MPNQTSRGLKLQDTMSYWTTARPGRKGGGHGQSVRGRNQLYVRTSMVELNLDFNTVYRNTITSYDPDELGRSSGKTGADNERILAFDELGLVDPVPYQDPWEIVLENARFSKKEFMKAVY